MTYDQAVTLYDVRIATRTTIGDLARAAGIRAQDVSGIEFGRHPIFSNMGRRYVAALAEIVAKRESTDGR